MRFTIRKAVSVLFILAMFVCLFPTDMKAMAASKPAKPKISVESIANGEAVIVTIKKTKNTDYYELYVKEPGDKKYGEPEFINKTGKKVRKYLVRTPKDGEYSIKVRGVFIDDLNYATLYGKYSKECSVKNKAVPKDLSELVSGDYVTFGSYEQDNNKKNGKEPIEWVVLSNSDSKLFLVSRYVLDGGNINPKTDSEVTYENSELREWLNNGFYKAAFNDKEAAVIKEPKLEDVNTADNVFLLSWDECKTEGYGLMEKQDRRCGATEYAQESHDRNGDGKKEYVDTCMGYLENNVCKTYDGEDSCYWWLRSKKDGEFMLIAERGGYTTTTYYGKKIDSLHRDEDGEDKFYVDGFGIRPAIVVDLKDAAGLVVSTGRKVEDQKTVFEAESSIK